MLMGCGHWEAAFRALLLVATNLICINLAGVTTFLAQGVHPLRWHEAEKAKRATAIAISLWTILLAALVILILLSRN
jgi:uncharacterized membrane protein